MVDQKIIDKVKQFLSLIPNELGLKEAYLFGSFVKGDEREGSDIDIALILENMSDYFLTQSKLRKIRRNVDLRIEPHPIKSEDFNNSNPFAYEVETTGIRVNIEYIAESNNI